MSLIPSVSVIIPAHNASNWIAETISSVIDQEFRDYEIIVVNDGSNDDTEAVVAGFNGKVQCIRKPNGGQASARNVGIREARGKYLAFVDADDLWTKDKLRLQVELLETTEAEWVYGDAFAFDGRSGRILYKLSRVRQYDGDILKPLLMKDFIPSPTPVVRRSVFERVGLFNERDSRRYGEDWDMWLRIAAIYPVALLRQPLAYSRIHSASMTARGDPLIRMQNFCGIIEDAVMREPVRLEPLRRRALSNIYIEAGRSLAVRGRIALGQRMFFQAMRLAPRSTLPYLYWVTAPAARLAKMIRSILYGY